jgi:hypothetical protein
MQERDEMTQQLLVLVGPAELSRLLVLVALGLMVAACGEPDPRYAEYEIYRQERTAVRVCREGTVVWAWRGANYVRDRNQHPDARVTVPLEQFCD